MKIFNRLIALGSTMLLLTGCTTRISEEEFYKKLKNHEVHQFNEATIIVKADLINYGESGETEYKRDDKSVMVYVPDLDLWDVKEGKHIPEESFILWDSIWDDDTPMKFADKVESGINSTVRYFSDYSVINTVKGKVESEHLDLNNNTVHHYCTKDYERQYKFNKYGYLTRYSFRGTDYTKDVATGNSPSTTESGMQGYITVTISYKD